MAGRQLELLFLLRRRLIQLDGWAHEDHEFDSFYETKFDV
jgi:hypothetical protein